MAARDIVRESLRGLPSARRGKRSRPDVAAFEFDLESNLLGLQRELTGETYRPGGYRNFVVHAEAGQ